MSNTFLNVSVNQAVEVFVREIPDQVDSSGKFPSVRVLVNRLKGMTDDVQILSLSEWTAGQLRNIVDSNPGMSVVVSKVQDGDRLKYKFSPGDVNIADTELKDAPPPEVPKPLKSVAMAQKTAVPDVSPKSLGSICGFDLDWVLSRIPEGMEMDAVEALLKRKYGIVHKVGSASVAVPEPVSTVKISTTSKVLTMEDRAYFTEGVDTDPKKANLPF